ncbi:MAG TPA: shikimate dehydrogenase [Gemmatimonadetes bacterium]|nr:shikimate dehydrogenase [Gemmatimonadota bacterium]
MSALTARTRVFTILGNPVEHSLSPVIQNAAFQEAQVDGVYVALRCDAEQMVGFMSGLGRSGGAGNVTLPHKEKAASVLDKPLEAVRRTGACNTFWGESGKLCGDNTDVEGFRRAQRHFLGGAATGYRVLLLGAGGAARAALVSLIDDEVQDVLILNRTVERARAVARRIGGDRVRVAESHSDVDDGEFDLVVNTTRLGLHSDDELPFDLERLSRADAVMDLVYGPSATAFVAASKRLGIPAVDGGEMLVHQGAAAFERWWGEEAPIDAMRQALEAARSSQAGA